MRLAWPGEEVLLLQAEDVFADVQVAMHAVGLHQRTDAGLQLFRRPGVSVHLARLARSAAADQAGRPGPCRVRRPTRRRAAGPGPAPHRIGAAGQPLCGLHQPLEVRPASIRSEASSTSTSPGVGISASTGVAPAASAAARGNSSTEQMVTPVRCPLCRPARPCSPRIPPSRSSTAAWPICWRAPATSSRPSSTSWCGARGCRCFSGACWPRWPSASA